MSKNDENKNLDLASKYINNTNCSIFLTGRAGTGKTTFLRSIVKNTHKKTVVAAPTGIAAINAGGITLHSLFHLPFGSFIPDNNFTENSGLLIHNPKSLIGGIKMNSAKRKLIKEMELVIIDEVSMLRADLLDAIDTILRHVRRKKEAFGGVQILFIGDLLQLPPVVKNQEWRYLNNYYKSSYFFEAQVLQNNKPVYIELEKIYRQTDGEFISILNNLRENKTTEKDIGTLNQYYSSSFETGTKEGYVFITTHNAKAEDINKKELDKIKRKTFTYEADIFGDFNETSSPLEKEMILKEGAQVMFIKNDLSPEKLYYNGKIGKISALTEDDIQVSFNDGSPDVYVEKYTWENKRFSLNKETGEIDEKVLGTFSHYPLKLAWAITVHKSQGLTFEKAIIDVSGAFAPGQVYVALSRLTSLKGLILNKPVPVYGIGQDKCVKEFSESKEDIKNLQTMLSGFTHHYIKKVTFEAFNFLQLKQEIYFHVESYSKDEKKSAKQKYISWAKDLNQQTLNTKEIADKFLKELQFIFQSNEKEILFHLKKRTEAALHYFEPILKDISKTIFDLIKALEKEKGVKKYTKELTDLELLFFKQLVAIQKSAGIINAVIENTELSKENLNEKTSLKSRKQELDSLDIEKKKEKKKAKEQKAKTHEITYNLYKEGKSIEFIAKERRLAISTIEGHLAKYVAKGEVDVANFVDKLKIKQIIKVSELIDTNKLGLIKEKLGDEFTYSDIRFALAYKEYVTTVESE